MKGHLILGLSLILTTTACQTGNNKYLRVEDYYKGYNFVGARFTPGGTVELQIRNAPTPCGPQNNTYCASGNWEPFGTVQAGPVGGAYPNPEGVFRLLVQRPATDQRLGRPTTCYPGESWSLTFSARDMATGHATIHHGSTTAGFFGELPRCP